MKGALQSRLEHILPQASEGLRPGGFRFCLSGQSRKRVEAWAWSAPRCGAPGRVIAKRAVSGPISKVLISAPVLHMFALVRSLPEGRRPGAPAQSPVVERACENADPEQERAGPRARFRSRGKTAGEGRLGANRRDKSTHAGWQGFPNRRLSDSMGECRRRQTSTRFRLPRSRAWR